MSRSAASASAAASSMPSAWADFVARYLDALRLTHYAADTVHIRTLYLKYFTTWATARGLTQLYTRVSIRLLKAVHTATHPAATLARPAAPPAADAATDQLEKPGRFFLSR